jgi:hypothetical protein
MYSDLFRNDTMHNIENEFAKTAGATRWHQPKVAGEKIHGFIDHVNEHMEMTSRIALFKALVDSGMPEQDAAIYSKNTMNFETKGRWGRQLGALYTFAGPALFDARRMAQSLRSPRGAAVLAAQFAAMYDMYGALKAMSGTDDDGGLRSTPHACSCRCAAAFARPLSMGGPLAGEPHGSPVLGIAHRSSNPATVPAHPSSTDACRV